MLLPRSRSNRNASVWKGRRRSVTRLSWRPTWRTISPGVEVEEEPLCETALEISSVRPRVFPFSFFIFFQSILPIQYKGFVWILIYCYCCPADLNQMHKLNEEAYSNPEQWQRRAKAAMMTCRAEHPDRNERVSGAVAESSIHDSSDRLSGTVTIFLLNVLPSYFLA